MSALYLPENISPNYPLVPLIQNGDAVGGELTGASNKSAIALIERTDHLRMLGICSHDTKFNYPVGAHVQVNGTVYRSKIINVNKPPATNPNAWDLCAMTLSELQEIFGLAGDLPVGYGIQKPTEAQRTQAQTNLGLQSSAQTQTHTSFTTTGAPPSYVGVFTPSPASLVANLRAQVTFHVGNNGAAVTLNVNGLGAKPIKQYSQIGTKITPVLFAGQISDVVFDGTDWVILDVTHNRSDAGMVNWFARSSPPEGYLECNGALVSRAAYQVLFWAIGTTFGAGDGSTTFQLPDLRGEFIRGWDHGRGIDVGRSFASKQLDQFQDHSHDTRGKLLGQAGNTVVVLDSSGTATGTGLAVTSGNRGTETRPRNIALLPCIKY